MNTQKLHCPVCSGDALSSEANYAAFENTLRFPKLGKVGLFGTKDMSIGPRKARVCLSCGFVLFFFSSKDLENLKEALSSRGT